jgi:hypothetical protein
MDLFNNIPSDWSCPLVSLFFLLLKNRSRLMVSPCSVCNCASLLLNLNGRLMYHGGMSTRYLHKGIGRPARKFDNLNAIWEPVVQKMWEPRCLTPCYTDSSTFTFVTSCRRMLTHDLLPVRFIQDWSRVWVWVLCYDRQSVGQFILE